MKFYITLALVILSCSMQQAVAGEHQSESNPRPAKKLRLNVSSPDEQQRQVLSLAAEPRAPKHQNSLRREINNLDNANEKCCLKIAAIGAVMAVGSFWAILRSMPDKDFKDLGGPAF